MRRRVLLGRWSEKWEEVEKGRGVGGQGRGSWRVDRRGSSEAILETAIWGGPRYWG